MFNIITATDSYKLNHFNMYPDGTTKVYSYFESRKGAKYDKTTFFGLQYLIKKYLEGVVVTQEKIDAAKRLVAWHLGSEKLFNEKMWVHILEQHGGRLPIKIRAVQEGLRIPTDNVLMTVENTDPECFALTNHLETLLTHVWSASTVATLSKAVKDVCEKYLEETSENPGCVNFMLHDFGYRGTSSQESAGFSGAGHLINFMGTDTIPAIEMVQNYYNEENMPAFSVPATEHSIMTSMGREGEEKLFGKLLKDYPTGILSVVIDSYNYEGFIRMSKTKYKNTILDRDGVLVFRPDSGDPVEVTKNILFLLDEYFGAEVNSKGYRVLNPKVRVLWGDGIDITGIEEILDAMMLAGYSAENIVFGMGGGLLQKINRDTQRFAFKSSYQERNGIGYNIFKDPIDGSKKSKSGRLALVKEDGEYKTIPEGYLIGCEEWNLLEVVFENGALTRDMNFSKVRENSNQ